MNESEKADWQHRVLSESELNQLLLTMSSLDAITVLQRQVELRGAASLVSAPIAEVSPPAETPSSESLLNAQTTDAVPTPQHAMAQIQEVEESVANEDAPVFEATSVPSAVAPVPGPIDSPNIATDLNAIFAARSAEAGLMNQNPVSATPAPTPLPEAETQPAVELSPSLELTAKPIAKAAQEPASWVPTFANPVPPVNSGVQSTPEIAPVQADSNEASPLASAAVALPVQFPVDDFKASIWDESDPLESSSVEERITQEDEPKLELSLGEPEAVTSGASGDTKQIFELDDAEIDSNGQKVVAVQSEPTGRRSAISLFTTWNGNGTLLLLTATGFLAGQSGIGLTTLVAGVFGALFLSGFGFAAAALAARRGRLPQSVLARATFGVIGSNIPLAVVVVARIAATALVSIFAVYALIWFFPSLPASFPIQVGTYNYSVSSLYPLLLGLVLTSGLVAFVAKKIYYSVAKVFALVLIAWSVGAVALSIWLKPAIYSFSAPISYPGSLWVATALIIVLGLLWGTSASDETPDLKSTTLVPKLVATSLLNSTILGSLAVVAGFAVFQMNLPAMHNATTGTIYAIVLIFGLANLIRRNTDAFRGFGLQRTPGWLFALNILVVAAGAIALAVRLGVSGAWLNGAGYLDFVGVPVLAWLTTFGMDSVLRRTDYHEVSLMRGYGFYGRFNWANLIGWLLATGIGWGFVTSNLVEFRWLGYFTKLLDTEATWQFQSLGVWIAAGFGLLVPLIFTVPRIRDQEAEVTAIEARRTELADVLGIAD